MKRICFLVILFSWCLVLFMLVSEVSSGFSLGSCTINCDETDLLIDRIVGPPGKSGRTGIRGSPGLVGGPGQRGPPGESCDCTGYALKTDHDSLQRTVKLLETEDSVKCVIPLICDNIPKWQSYDPNAIFPDCGAKLKFESEMKRLYSTELNIISSEIKQTDTKLKSAQQLLRKLMILKSKNKCIKAEGFSPFHNCSKNGICIFDNSTSIGFKCKCKNGFIDGDLKYIGTNCSDIDECLTQYPCHHFGDCKNTIGSYNCKCAEEYDDQDINNPGINCIPKNKCIKIGGFSLFHNCSKHGICIFDNSTLIGFECKCKSGFMDGDLKYIGTNCLDIDECLTQNPCHHFANCKNTIGSYSCKCSEGYKDKDIVNPGTNCTPKNKCIKVEGFPPFHNCSKNGICIFDNSTSIDFKCKCKNGFNDRDMKYIGTNCADIDECRTQIPCHRFANCYNTIGSYSCKCSKGYKDQALHNPGTNCIDIDECVTLNTCHRFANCYNTNGHYSCKCLTGYKDLNYHKPGTNCIVDNKIKYRYTRFSNNIWYKLHKNKVNYATAKQTCASEGGRLASTGLRNYVIRENIKRDIARPSASNIWIGLDDLTDIWMWSDGIVSTRSNTDWYKKEPSSGKEDCGEMRLNHDWQVNDEVCTTESYFLCEIS